MYNNISSCVLNNGYSTSSFAVRQGDPLSAHLFIMVLEILCISIRSNNDIQDIPVDNEEIKLGLDWLCKEQPFFDTVFRYCRTFRKMLWTYKVNEENTEILLLGTCVPE